MTEPERKTAKRRKRAATPAANSSLREVTRKIKPSAMAMLWGRAAARCEFSGCNKPLWKSPVTQEGVNIAQMAHIYSFSVSGPRGNAGIADEDLNSLENLLLVCHACHRKIDQKEDGGRYSPQLLQQMKVSHERRIELVTGIDPGRQSHVLLYGANVGDHHPALSFQDAASAMFPDFYPANDLAIELSMLNDPMMDDDAKYWDLQATRLRSLFQSRVRDRLSPNDIRQLSVFAIAPQPLLILLGTLLGDIANATVYQRHREPTQSWAWPAVSNVPSFDIIEPASAVGTPVLILAISATVTSDRITRVLGPDVSIWTVTVAAPHNEVVKTKEQLVQFRQLLRPLLDRIKAIHGQLTTLHVFPATPVSVSIDFGRVRMPKADMPLLIYDQVNSLGGFVPALSFSAPE